MTGIYFSGTGNSEYCIKRFLQEYDEAAKAYSIEEEEAIQQIRNQDEIVFCYPVQYSNIPLVLREFIMTHKELWKGKRIYVMATMALFSGDGAGVLARLLKSYGAVILGGLHLKMPDSICDERVLKRTLEANRKIIADAGTKIKEAVQALKEGKPMQEGIGVFYHLVGLFGQRLYFINKTKKYSSQLKINGQECIGCGNCASLCPMNNIKMQDKMAIASSRCTLCYRCVNKCPKQAITLLGNQVIEQGNIEQYV